MKEIIKTWMEMDIENPGNEEFNVLQLVENNEATKGEVFSTLEELSTELEYNEKSEFYCAMEILLATLP